MTSPPRRLRRQLSAVAVLGLASAAVAMGIPAPAQATAATGAPEEGNRAAQSWQGPQFTVTGYTRVFYTRHYEEDYDNYASSYFGPNVLVGHAQTVVNAGSRELSSEAQAASLYSGDNFPAGALGGFYSAKVAGQPDSPDFNQPGAGGTSNEGHIVLGHSEFDGFTALGERYHCLPVGEVMARTENTVSPTSVTSTPQDGSTPVRVESLTAGTSLVQTKTVPAPTATPEHDLRGAVTRVDGDLGVYNVDDTFTVTVTRVARLTHIVYGYGDTSPAWDPITGEQTAFELDNSTLAFEPAEINIDGPEGQVTLNPDNGPHQQYVYTDPETQKQTAFYLGTAMKYMYRTDPTNNPDAYMHIANGNTFSVNITVPSPDPTIENNNTVLTVGELGTHTQTYGQGIDCTPPVDTDEDGLYDFEETDSYGTDPENSDSDSDGLTDGAEVHEHNTDPAKYDTDNDGLNDAVEVNGVTNPLNPDSDNDALLDGAEVNTVGTDPNDADSDDDGLGDGEEVNQYNTLPLVPDTDGDGLIDGYEVHESQTSPLDPDSDNGGTNDGDEVSAGTDPNNGGDDYQLQDTDNDGLTGAQEDQYGTSPTDPDTDDDGLTDGAEVNTTLTDPTNPDTDEDGLNDGDELANDTDPFDSDSDDDGLSDGDEVNETIGTDPLVADTDDDGLLDGEEVNSYNTNPLVADTDGDDLSDGEEVNVYDTDPNNSDSDTDGLNDGQEVNEHKTDPNDADTDNDSLGDGQEVLGYHTDPLASDTDDDDLDDAAEVNQHHTNPLVADTDGGSVKDGPEVTRGTNPLDPKDDVPVVTPPTVPAVPTVPNDADADNDGLSDVREAKLGTNPFSKDTDRDGLRDSREVNKVHSNPLKKDTDKDGLSDGVEVKGFANKAFHRTFTSNPLRADSDKDGLRDRVEVTGARNGKFGHEPSNPLNKDSDGGGVDDLQEILVGSNPSDVTSGPGHAKTSTD